MYEIYYKDLLVFKIGEETENDKRGCVNIINDKYLPFDIYLEESNDFDDRFNNAINFQSWCANRVLALDRTFAKEILNYYGLSQNITDASRAKIAITVRCMSLNDCYWLKRENEKITWEDVNLFQNSLENSILEVALLGKNFTITNNNFISPDISTDGKAAKAWLRKEDDFYLLKGDKADSVRREVEASQMLKKLGFANVIYEYDKFRDQIVSKCKCFTNDKINFTRAEWFSIWCINHDESIMDYILRYKELFDQMNLADYLIGNTDEHSQNWGFLYNNDRQILGLNPHMDFDHAFLGTPCEICLPMQFIGIRKTQEEVAEEIIAMHPEWIENNIDFSEFYYGDFVKGRINHLKEYLQNKIAAKEDIELG